MARAIVTAAFSLTVRSMGTTVLALGCGLLGTVAPAVIKLYQKGWKVGWPMVKASLAGDAGYGLAIAFLIWTLLFIFSLGKATERLRGADDDASSLYMVNVKLQNKIDGLEAKLAQRRLDDEQIRVLVRIIKQGLAAQGLDKLDHKIYLQLYSLESDRETVVYRAYFERAFQEAGLGVALGELVGTAGEPENEQFVGAVSIVHGSPKNIIRPLVLEALRAAGVSPYECNDLPRHAVRYTHGPGGQSLGATLIIGQRA